MPAPTKRPRGRPKLKTKAAPVPRYAFCLYPEDMAVLEAIQSHMRQRNPDVHVNRSDALRYWLREYPKYRQNGQKKS